MEESGGAAAAAGAATRRRVFVGGLSESVAAADLEAMFARMGVATAAVELVRSSGRCFAYVDLDCPSDRALAKLFSTYNGCTWKGGKLRVEKAKEHYLTRLKREWEEDTAQTVPENSAVKKDGDKLMRLEKVDLENMKLNMFFPKFRKVKSLPFKGTGKHKYSFRNVEVPPYPIHFCDCEEHCGPPETANERYASVLNAAAYEKELNIMNSVMSKLFERENEQLGSPELQKTARDAHIDVSEPSEADNDLQMEEAEEPPEEDSDDLVINIGVGQSDDLLMHFNGQEKRAAKQDSQMRKRQRFREASQQKRQKFVPAALSESEARKRQESASMMASRTTARRKALPNRSEAVRDQEPSPGLAGKGTDELSSVLPGKRSSANLQELAHTTSSSAKSESELTVHAAEPKKSSSWIQKSSWRELVGETGNTSFSISQVLPNASAVPPQRPNAATFHAKSKRQVRFGAQAPKPSEAPNQHNADQTPARFGGVPSIGTPVATTATGGDSGEREEKSNTEQVRVVPKISIGEVCPFMRTAESEKQWSKAKKALTGFIKKKNNENSESNNVKGKFIKKKNNENSESNNVKGKPKPRR